MWPGWPHYSVRWLKERARDHRQTDNLALLSNFYRDEIQTKASAKYDRDLNHGSDIVFRCERVRMISGYFSNQRQSYFP